MPLSLVYQATLLFTHTKARATQIWDHKEIYHDMEISEMSTSYVRT